jgi:GT2 family glycosyltransferase
VVVPTLRRGALARCLDALGRQTVPDALFEVVIVEDASVGADAPRPAVAANVRELRAARPGASAARNTGWRAARGDVVLFVDDDVLAAPDLLARHIAGHEREPGIGAGVLGTLTWARELRVTPFMEWLDTGIQFDHRTIVGDEAEWWHFYTANLSVKRAALEQVGGFDEERFPFLYEDLDLGRRLHDAVGLRLRFDRAATAEHLSTVTLETWKGRLGRLAESERRFVERYPEADPYFHRIFSEAMRHPRASGRSARLAEVVPRWVPVLGPRLREGASWYFRQELAEGFLAAWESSAGASPGGPK